MGTFKLNLTNANSIVGSNGTLRSADLLPRFSTDLSIAVDLLKSQYASENETFLPFEERFINDAFKLVNDCEVFHKSLNYGNDWNDYPSEFQPQAQDFIQDLIDSLNQIAPEDHYFGSHPGDGSDFAFWEWVE